MLRSISFILTNSFASINSFKDFHSSLLAGIGLAPFFIGQIDRKFLTEYRCPTCNKLLSKGYLKDKDSFLEVMCRTCKTVHVFTGDDAEIIKVRSDLIREGKITGYELSETEKKQE